MDIKALILIMLLFLVSGCGGMKTYVYANKDGLSCINDDIILEKPIVIVKSNRPSKVDIEIDKEGNIKSSIDGRNKNNIDKAMESILPLIAVKNA